MKQVYFDPKWYGFGEPVQSSEIDQSGLTALLHSTTYRERSDYCAKNRAY
jgi:hypothetical protein